MHLFCFGLGYVAEAFARRLLADGWRVSGTCRSEARFDKWRELGVTAHVFDDGAPLLFPDDALSEVTHVLHSVPPGESGDGVYASHADDLRRLPGLAWFGYLSTTGVYGDCGGARVDERSPTGATEPRAIRRIEAENTWLASGLPVHVFRLSGIYGPGRNALEKLRDGTARRIIKPGQVFSRIHIDDITQALCASVASPAPGEAYNVADDLPAASDEIIAYAAELLGVPLPDAVPFDDPSLPSMTRSFYGACRRVANDKMKRELGVKLLYPDYKAGLRNLLNT
ncbi:MAG: SDR family oxidoreductase [Rickettsiales bacterium]